MRDKCIFNHPFAHSSLMSDKAKKHPLSNRPPKKAEPPAESPTPIIPIRNSGLADALKHGSRVYELMVDSVRDYAIFMLDPDGHVASWNKGAQRIKGYTASEIIGRHFSAFYPPEDIASDKPARELKIAMRVRGNSRKRVSASGKTAACSGRASSSPRCATKTGRWSDSRKSPAT